MSGIAARVAFVCSTGVWGGTEKWALRAAEELAARGREVHFVARHPHLFLERAQAEGTVAFHRLPLRNDGDLVSALRLAGLLRTKADVVVNTRVRDYWLGGLAARLAGVPSLLRLGVVRSPRSGHLMDRLRYGLLPSAWLVNARAIRDVLAGFPPVDASRVHVLYNGVEAPGPPPPRERERIRKEALVPEDGLLVVGAGRLAEEKRWDWLVSAVQEGWRRDLPLHLRILGSGSEEARLARRISDIPDVPRGTIRLEGHRADAADWLGAADIAAQPSRNEGLSNTMLEAMGRGTAVAATLAGGAAERFEDGRELMLAGNQDFEGFTERLLALAGDGDLRARIGAAGLEAVRARFRWDAMAEQLGELLDQLAGGKR